MKILDIILTVTVMLAVICIWLNLLDCNRFVVRHITLTDKRIRHKVRAAMISDLHNKRFGRDNEQLLEAIRVQKPDVIFSAGDIMTARPRAKQDVAIRFLEALSGEYPVYYANGNHEHRIKLYPKTYHDMAQTYAKELERLGIEPMVNVHERLGEAGITVYGLEMDARFYKRFRHTRMEESYLKSVLGEPDEDSYTVLLAHNPDYFPEYATWGADLVLSGHVHGGLVRVPFWGKGVVSPSLRLFPKYDGGVFSEEDKTMVLSRGLGLHTIPLRLFNPAEFWVIDFVPAADETRAASEQS